MVAHVISEAKEEAPELVGRGQEPTTAQGVRKRCQSAVHATSDGPVATLQ